MGPSKIRKEKTLPLQHSSCWAARLPLPLPLWCDSHQTSNLQQLGQSEIKLKLRFTNYTIALQMTLSKKVAPSGLLLLTLRVFSEKEMVDLELC